MTGIVAIVDDDELMRERYADFVLSKNFEPLIFKNRLPSIEMLVHEAKAGGASYVVCDHRLIEKGRYATFLGAEAVARFYDSHQIAPLLVTAYETLDSEMSIRPHRRKIPMLLHRSQVTPDTLIKGLSYALEEAVERRISKERKPHSAILTITDIVAKGKDQVVRVVITQWDPHTDVGFPLSMMPPEIQIAIRPGDFLYADVNVNALRSEDLYFDNFRMPNQDDVRAAATILNNP